MDTAATSTTEPPETSVSTPTTEKPAAEVQVVSANGSSVSGLASKTNTFLAQAGYSNSVATDSLQPATTTTVYYATGLEGNAKAIATLLNVPVAQVQPLAADAKLAKNQPATAGVIVIIGPELQTVVGGTTASSTPGASTSVAAGGTSATSGTGGSSTTVAGRTASTTTTAP